MSQFDDDDSKPWTEDDLREAMRRINAGEINFKEAEDYYGISPRTIHRQKAIENMRAQLNPEKAKKTKTNAQSSTKKDVTVLRKPVDISCSSFSDVVTLLDTGTEEVKQLLNYECDLIYECKVCKNLFRSLVNFISHKRLYCCDMYSVLHTRSDKGEDGNEISGSKKEDKIKSKENLKEFSAKPFRITCRKDLTSVLKRITAMTEFATSEPMLQVEQLESTPNAYQQALVSRRSSDVIESSKSTPEQADNAETSVEVESKLENSTVVTKIPEKLSEKSSSFVAEKRFRCPVCSSNFTIKKSVMRHLKAVHNQSIEQVERLKSRIQMHYVRKKSSSIENKTSLEEKPASTVDNSKTESISPNQSKAPWEKVCVYCDRLFTNRNSYAAHTRGCKKNAIIQASNAESTNASSKKSLQPVVSLTPISSSFTKTENDEPPAAAASVLRNSNKKVTASVASKKVALPLSSTSSSSAACKKIGIQVRMNYGKANANQAATSINGNASASAYPSTPVSVATPSSTQSSANNSRRSSFVAGAKNGDELTNGHPVHERDADSGNGGVLIDNILETLLGRRHRAKESATVASASSDGLSEKCAPDKESIETSGAARKKLPKHEVSVYCEDCCSSFTLGDFACDSADGITRNFRCALRNCDFRCNDKRQLLPHLTLKHPILSENELAEIESTFIVETSGRGLCSFERKKILSAANDDDKTEESGGNDRDSVPCPNETTVSNKGVPVPNENFAIVEEGQSPKPQLEGPPSAPPNAPLKRKMLAVAPPSKRKPLNLKQNSMSQNEARAAKKEPGNSVPVGNVAPSVKRDRSVGDEVTGRTAALPAVKKTKKTANTSVRNRFNLIPLIRPLKVPEKTVVNGVASSSSDEENDLPATVANAKTKSNSNCGVAGARKQNVLLGEAKSTKTPTAKLVNSHATELLSSSSSTPDSDLDPSSLTEENLKKSIMTIIFGKDVPTQKIEEREKSPSLSSTSSDSGKEKRYSVRIAKQSTSTKSIVPVIECKEEKITKMTLANKVKATR